MQASLEPSGQKVPGFVLRLTSRLFQLSAESSNPWAMIGALCVVGVAGSLSVVVAYLIVHVLR